MLMAFLTPRIERLRSDGTFETLHPGAGLGRFRTPVVLLARDLCAFSLFETSSLPGNRRRMAARLHARTAAPYTRSGSILASAGRNFGVWWWDLSRIEPFLEARFDRRRPVLRPETLAQPAGRDWRLVRLTQGYEAQLWNDRTLVASAWRQDRFDQPAWNAFARLQRNVDAPEVPPLAQPLPVDFAARAFAPSLAEITREQALALGAGVLAAACLCASLFMVGQGMRLADDASTIMAEAQAMRDATPRAEETADADRLLMTAYREIEEQTHPLSAAGAAISIVAIHDLTPSALEVRPEELVMRLPYSAARQIDTLAGEFEGSGYFYDVRPRTDAASATLIIEMKIRESVPPLTPDG